MSAVADERMKFFAVTSNNDATKEVRMQRNDDEAMLVGLGRSEMGETAGVRAVRRCSDDRPKPPKLLPTMSAARARPAMKRGPLCALIHTR